MPVLGKPNKVYIMDVHFKLYTAMILGSKCFSKECKELNIIYSRLVNQEVIVSKALHRLSKTYFNSVWCKYSMATYGNILQWNWKLRWTKILYTLVFPEL